METELVVGAVQALVVLVVTLLGGRQLQRSGGATVLSSVVQQLRQAKIVDVDGDGEPDTVDVLVQLLRQQIADGVRAGLTDVHDRLGLLETTVETLVETLEDQVTARIEAQAREIAALRAEVEAIKEAV